jgi:hypothetical protein
MIALSIRQPWAWLIVNGFKTIENRSWLTNYRGPMLIHAGKVCTPADYDAAMLFVEGFAPELVLQVPDIGDLQLGGVVGGARLVDCLQEHPSPWFTGGAANNAPGTVGYGFVLAQAAPLPFLPWKGRQGFFDVVVRP